MIYAHCTWSKSRLVETSRAVKSLTSLPRKNDYDWIGDRPIQQLPISSSVSILTRLSTDLCMDAKRSSGTFHSLLEVTNYHCSLFYEEQISLYHSQGALPPSLWESSLRNWKIIPPKAFWRNMTLPSLIAITVANLTADVGKNRLDISVSNSNLVFTIPFTKAEPWPIRAISPPIRNVG